MGIGMVNSVHTSKCTTKMRVPMVRKSVAIFSHLLTTSLALSRNLAQSMARPRKASVRTEAWSASAQCVKAETAASYGLRMRSTARPSNRATFLEGGANFAFDFAFAFLTFEILEILSFLGSD